MHLYFKIRLTENMMVNNTNFRLFLCAEIANTYQPQESGRRINARDQQHTYKGERKKKKNQYIFTYQSLSLHIKY